MTSMSCRADPGASLNCRKPAGPTSDHDEWTRPAQRSIRYDVASQSEPPHRRRRHDGCDCLAGDASVAGARGAAGHRHSQPSASVHGGARRAPGPGGADPRLGGGALDLASLRGKMVLVNFWATWCPACRTELPILDRLARNGRADLAVVAITTDRDRSLVSPFVKKLKLRHLPIGFDPGGLVARAGASDGIDTPFALYGMPISSCSASPGRSKATSPVKRTGSRIEARRVYDCYARAGAGD